MLSNACFDFQDAQIAFKAQAEAFSLAIKLFKQMENQSWDKKL